MIRPSWDKYFSDMTHLIATRSPCLRRQCGAVIVKDRQILSTGYNGPPRGIEHCQVCYREEHNIPHGKMYETCKALHAEQNAMLQAARHGVSIKDADIYITGVPCIMCARMIINAGLRTVYVSNDSLAKEYITSLVLLHDIGINVIRVIE